jgi:hypothetical protein
MIYSQNNLPSFISGTSGYAIPAPELRVACPVPTGVTSVLAPWELQAVHPGHWHVIIEVNIPNAATDTQRVSFWPENMDKSTPRNDEYLNDEVLTTYSPVCQLALGDSVLGDSLITRYPGVPVFEVSKKVPAIVLGQVAEDIEFSTSESGMGKAAKVPAGSYILKSPLADRFYFITTAKLGKLYDGTVIPGEIPAETLSEVRAAWAKFGF